MSSFYEEMFKLTELEIELNNSLEELDKNFESSEEYIKYNEEKNRLFNELIAERKRKMRSITPPLRGRGLKTFKTSKKDENVKYESVNKIIDAIKNFSSQERRVFNIELMALNGDKLDDYENPITTEKNIDELQEILVQTCINYINENNLTDIYEVSFSADDLGESAKFGKWTPSTDSHIRVVGIQEDNTNDFKIDVRRKIGENW